MTRAQAAFRLRALEARVMAIERAFNGSLVLNAATDERLREDAREAAYDLLAAADKVAQARRYIDRKVIT
jgi:hypothetical protein